MAKFALLIGVSEYQPGLNALSGAVQDVKAMQRVLQHSEMGDFADANMTVLENPPRQEMERAIENLFSHRQKDDLVLLYFSGHGIKDDSGKLYLATSETSKHQSGELIQTTATAASLIHGMMENSRSRRQVIILDCCFSGAFAEGMKAKDDNTVDIKNQLGGEGRAVLTSSTSTQYSFEQQGADLSVYTRYIVEGIEKGAADTDNDGMISVDELHEYARKKVQEAAPAMKPEIYAVREGFKIKIAKAPVGDPQLEYRKEVERCVRNGNISVIGRRILKRRQSELGLSVEVATQIENEVLEPYRQYQANLKEYAEALAEAIQNEGILSQHTQEELKWLQQLLNLTNEDIANIEAQLTRPSTFPDSPNVSELTSDNESSITLTPSSPKWAYAAWHISKDDRQKLHNSGIFQLSLRLYDVTNIDLSCQTPQLIQEYECEVLQRDRYVAIPTSDCDYMIALGYLTEGHSWEFIIRSTSVHIPTRPHPDFWFVVDIELIIHCATEPDATVTINNDNIKLKPDGTFHLRIPVSDSSIIYLMKATSVNGKQTQTIYKKFSQENLE